MRTVEIVKGLLQHAEITEWNYGVDNTQRYCPECGEETDWEFQDDHDPSCKLMLTMKAAREYLRLMEGAKA